MPVSFYLAKADSFLKMEVVPQVEKDVVRLSYLAKGPSDLKRYAGELPERGADLLDSLEWIGFFYEYASSELDYTFHWYLTIGSDGQVGPEWMLRKTIPACIRQGFKCNLLTKGQALAIAIRDSLPHPDNYFVELVSPKRSDEFYWVFIGVDKKITDYSIPSAPGVDKPVPPRTRRTTRIVNAVTGRLVPLKEYYALEGE